MTIATRLSPTQIGVLHSVGRWTLNSEHWRTPTCVNSQTGLAGERSKQIAGAKHISQGLGEGGVAPWIIRFQLFFCNFVSTEKIATILNFCSLRLRISVQFLFPVYFWSISWYFLYIRQPFIARDSQWSWEVWEKKGITGEGVLVSYLKAKKWSWDCRVWKLAIKRRKKRPKISFFFIKKEIPHPFFLHISSS